MGKADNLSRRPDWEVGVERDNKNETLVKPEWLEVRRTETKEMKRVGVKILRDEEWREVDCHDLANQLSHYLFSFSFLFFSFQILFFFFFLFF